MTVRKLRKSDHPHLQAMQGSFPYPSLDDSLEAILVIADSDDKPIMACAAKRLVELYLWVDDATPATKLAALRLMQHAMASELRELGYGEAECFLPPEIEASFGRRIVRTLGAVKNWASYCIKF